MKLGSVTKLNKKTRQLQKKKKKMSVNYDVNIIFPIYISFGAMRKSNSEIFTFSGTVTFYLTKTENRTKKSLTQLLCYCFEYKYYFCKKNANFLEKNDGLSKIKSVLVLKDIFTETK